MRINRNEDDLNRVRLISENPANASEELWGPIPGRLGKVAQSVSRQFFSGTPDQEDLENEIFCKLIEGIVEGKFQTTVPLEIWAFKVAKNRAIDLFRQRKRQPMFANNRPSATDDEGEDLVAALPSGDRTPEEEVEWRQDAGEIRNTISLAAGAGGLVGQVVGTLLSSPEEYIKATREGQAKIDLGHLKTKFPGFSYQQVRRAVQALRSTLSDDRFADDLEQINRADRPPTNPWASPSP